MSWSPPNRGYTLDPVTGVPLESKFDPGEMPEGVEPTIRILGSHDPNCGCPFLVINTRTGGTAGFKFPPDSES